MLINITFVTFLKNQPFVLEYCYSFKTNDSHRTSTNAIIALLQKDYNLIQLLQDAEWIGISVISQIEFLAFSGLSKADIELFRQFLQRVEVIDLSGQNELLIAQIISIRQEYRLKLPDAIIAAMARENSAKLVTRDTQLNRVADLIIVDW